MSILSLGRKYFQSELETNELLSKYANIGLRYLSELRSNPDSFATKRMESEKKQVHEKLTATLEQRKSAYDSIFIQFESEYGQEATESMRTVILNVLRDYCEPSQTWRLEGFWWGYEQDVRHLYQLGFLEKRGDEYRFKEVNHNA